MFVFNGVQSRALCLLLVLIGVACLSSIVRAAPDSHSGSVNNALSKPEERVVLTVTGSIAITNGDGIAEFDRVMLQNKSQHEINTQVPWLEGKYRFTGPLMRDLLSDLGATGKSLRIRAMDGYSVVIPVSDFSRYNVILAISRDGQRMRVRDRGPTWIMYPFDAVPELKQELYYRRSIWQIVSIEVF
ncbi:MAG: oxidoreductase [Pseudomonadales bacterium]|nr:oxidoreductase [Pseudomonadales bacterium]